MIDIACLAGVVYKQYIYFSHLDYNSLYRINTDNWDAEWILSFPEVDFYKKKLHRKAIVWKDEIYFFPLNGKVIHKFNPDTLEVAEIGSVYKDETVEAHFTDVICVDNVAYLIPEYTNESLVSFDFNSYTIRVITLWKDSISKISKEVLRIANCASVYTDGVIRIALSNTNKIISWDVSKNRITDTITLKDDIKLRNIEIQGNKIWFSMMNSMDIVGWDMVKDTYQYLRIPENSKKGDAMFRPIVVGNKLYAIPLQIGDLYQKKADKDELCRISVNENISGINRLRLILVCDDKVYLLPQNGETVLVIDKEDDKIFSRVVQEVKTERRLNFEIKFLEDSCAKGHIVEEGYGGISFESFIEFLNKKEEVR